MRYLLLLFFIISFIQAGNLSQKKELYAEAKEFLSQQKYQKAYDAFHDLFKQNLEDPNINFYLGRSAYMLKKYELAISSYERVLMVDKNSMRTKLELAKCYYALKDYKKAKEIFLEVVKGNLPMTVQQNINMYLKTISSRTKKNFITGSFVVGVNYDTNIYSRASNDIFTIPGIIDNITNQPIVVKNTTTNASGYSHQEALTLNHLYRFEKDGYYFKDNIIAFNKQFFKNHDRDIQMLEYSPALSVVYNKSKVMVDYALLYDNVWLDGDSYIKLFGIYPKLKYVYTANTILSAGFKYVRKEFNKNGDKNRNSNIEFVEFNIDYIYSDTIILSSYTQLYNEKKIGGSLTNIDNTMLNFALSTSYRYNRFLSIAPKMQWFKKNYNEVDSFYLKKQKDNEFQFLLNTSYRYKKNMSFNLSYMYMKHESNIVSWEFDKQSITTNLILLF